MTEPVFASTTTDQLLAEVALAALSATQQSGCRGAFIDVELDLWHAAQARLGRSVKSPLPPSAGVRIEMPTK